MAKKTTDNKSTPVAKSETDKSVPVIPADFLQDAEDEQAKEAVGKWTKTMDPDVLIKLAESRGETLSEEDLQAFKDLGDMGAVFQEMMLAEITGEEPDFSNFGTPPAPIVTNAVDLCGKQSDIDFSKNVWAEMEKVKKLFTPAIVREDNSAYRALVRKGRHTVVKYLHQVFDELRDSAGVLDAAIGERAFRRLDTEINKLDDIAREDLLFNFSNEILSTSFAQPVNYWVNTENFDLLTNTNKTLLRDLLLFYNLAKEHTDASGRGHYLLNNEFGAAALNDIISLQEKPPERAYDYETRLGVSKNIQPEKYYQVLFLTRALFDALPTKVASVVESSLEKSFSDIRSTTSNNSLSNKSRYLRSAFIAIAQGRGSFEHFFIALYQYKLTLSTELYNKLEVARCLVGLYDSLDLNIGATLEASKKRILESKPF